MKEFVLDIAGKELAEVLSVTPLDPLAKHLFFFEMTRVLGYWSTYNSGLSKEAQLPGPIFTMIGWGWNLAAEYYFSKLSRPGFPMFESTSKTRADALAVLHKFGRCVLLRRVADMLGSGMLEGEVVDGRYVFRRVGVSDAQVVDNLEYEFLNELNLSLEGKLGGFYNGWNLTEFPDVDILPKELGAFHGKVVMPELKAMRSENIRELMSPLVRPWDSGFGVMMAYDAIPETDAHFFSVALEMVIAWRDEAGIHPAVKLDIGAGYELSVVVAAVLSLHLKHLSFLGISVEKYPEILLEQSLTIWKSRSELIETVEILSRLDGNVVARVVDGITFFPEDIGCLKGNTTPFSPLLIGLGNEQIIMPVWCVNSNPFASLIKLFQWRNSRVENSLAKYRENWQRSNLYYIFGGNRYELVKGNVNLRIDGVFLTDVDGAIFDSVTGELALFQLKWQDYFTNDVKSLRSKTSNLAKELEGWGHKVSSWIDRFGSEGVAKSLRLKLKGGQGITGIYLFAISQSVARTGAYGFKMRDSRVAVATWPQFVRLRTEVGPACNVFSELHSRIKEEVEVIYPSVAIPYTSKFSSVEISFEDVWRGY
ncbi:hypothetical protein PMI30_03017 [Pseudomonas sp. GM50]|uniref:hypothetical protein n=1 Tax=Pseudomonas sp. GM50 TaxID=1144332 RepID=UPI000270B810|nr:hypothetical protein [Pseudomonas sp. GM50]EJM65882.1 hypothetical protein PMI30_03017 [Pseudomonas sp. GM50]